MKNQNRVRRETGSKAASAQVRGPSATQAGKGLKTYRVFTAAAGETDMTKWQVCESIQARSPLAAARARLGQCKRPAVCRFNQGGFDYLFERVARRTPGNGPDRAAGTLTFQNHRSGRAAAHIGLTAKQVANLERAADQAGMNLNGFICLALLKASPPAPAPEPATPPQPTVATPLPLFNAAPIEVREVCATAGLMLELREAGSAAGALAVLQAETIRTGVKDCAEWGDVEAPRLADGARELARMSAVRFGQALTALDKWVAAAMREVPTAALPIAPLPDNEASMNRWGELGVSALQYEVESAVGQLEACVRQQASVLADHHEAGAMPMGEAVATRLNAAYTAASSATRRLGEAVLAVRELGGERRAA